MMQINFSSFPLSFLIANAVVIICTSIVIIAILLDFFLYHKPKESKKKNNSWVETGTMFLYFFAYYLILKSKLGGGDMAYGWLRAFLSIFGSFLILIGCYFNVKGRFVLKQNWANQVTIYHNHTLVTHNVYKIVRHPLYASLIWMLIGGSLIYSNYASLISVLIIFVPMMYYRGRQEEALLMSEFPEYAAYKRHTSMFFPKIFKNG